MTMFNYAQSNSLLKREIEEKHNDEKSSSGTPSNDLIPAQRSGALAPASVGAVGIPVSDVGTSASSGKTKEKSMPLKKTQRNKHKFTNGSVAATNNVIDHRRVESGNNSVTENAQDSNGINLTDAKNDVESKAKKMRIRKPRRIIPKEKEYIPEHEQPTQSDVVGGRGGKFS